MFAGYTATLTIIPPFAIDLGGDPSYHLPLIVGAFGFVGLLIRPFGGQWIYTLGPKRVAVAGTIIVALGSLSYIFALSPWWLMPMRMLQGRWACAGARCDIDHRRQSRSAHTPRGGDGVHGQCH